LLYVLARRLQERQPVAFQIDPFTFYLFSENGVSRHSTNGEFNTFIPIGAWALSDSFEDFRGPCHAFRYRQAHVIYTSSPVSRRWKEWAKQFGAIQYIMDVWEEEELRTMLFVASSNTLITLTHRTSTIMELNVERGVGLFKKYGPSPRVIVEILLKPGLESDYLAAVKSGAVALASRFSEMFFEVEMLDFTSDLSSKIFTVRRGPKRLRIPTAFLASTLAVAVSAQSAALQNTFFMMLSGHASLRSAAGWMFENFAHVRFSDPKGIIPMKGYLHGDPNAHTIPTAPMISGPSVLSSIQPPFNFYWRPLEPNFPGIDALIRVDYIVWALQFTISASHSRRTTTKGLDEVRKKMNHKGGVEWRLVMVCPTLQDAKSLRDRQALTGGWKNTPVYACELPLGRFDANQMEQLQGHFEEVSPIVITSLPMFCIDIVGCGNRTTPGMRRITQWTWIFR
jgi:hypothetical protein